MKTPYAALGCLCVAASAWAQNLQVVTPSIGAKWMMGTTQQIKWQAKYLGTPALVRGQIILERKGQQVGLINPDVLLVSTLAIGGTNTPVGSFKEFSLSWVVQSSPGLHVAPSVGYRIRLRPEPPNPSFPEAVSAVFPILAQTAGDVAGNQIAIKPGECVISSFKVVARPNDPTHVAIRVEVQNLRYTSAAGLQLHLIKNHLELKMTRIPQMARRTRWHLDLVDGAPAEFKTSNYIAILSTGNPSTEPASVLDRKEAKFRRAGTVYGVPR
jgi:hypothetical protein